MIEHALQYAGRGWRIFRLTGYKTPLKGSHGHLDATTDIEVIRSWWQERPKANIGLATGDLVVLDADGPGGLAELLSLAAPHGGLPRTLTAQTSRGFHFYFALPAGVRLRSRNAKRTVKGGDGLDLKADGGFVVLSPSVNAKTGFVYRWALDVPAVEMPPWLIAWCQEQSGSRQGETKAASRGAQPSSFGVRPLWLSGNNWGNSGTLTERVLAAERRAELPDLLAALKVIGADPGYDRWFEAGAAIHDFDSGPDGLAIFQAWSRSSERHLDQADAACERKWSEYGKDKGSKALITKASLYAWANEKALEESTVKPESFVANNAVGGVETPPAAGSEVGNNVAGDNPFKQQNNTFGKGTEQAHHSGMNGHSFEANGSPFGEAAPGGFGTGTAANPLIELNNKYAVIGDVGSKCLVLSWVPSKVDEVLRVPSFQTFKSFSERYANKYVTVAHTNDKGEKKEESKQLGSHWLKWPKRRSFEGIDLIPGGAAVLGGNILNLWSGFAVQPCPPSAGGGSWALMRAHICNVLANGDGAAAEYILKFAAWCVQHPAERAEVALVFKGGKGSGKGTFANALKRIFGQHGLQIFNSKHLVGAFNGHLRNCLLLFADEAFWAGDRPGESVLKGMLTEPALMIEQKGVDAAPWRNRLKVIMAANADWVVPASHDERRYAMFDVSAERIGDRAYFKALHFELLTGGLPAMLHDLLQVDLGEWHPREIVLTEALQEQKSRSLAPLLEWWEQVLQEGMLPYSLAKSPHIVTAQDMLEHARNSVPRLKDTSVRGMGLWLRKLKAEAYHADTGNFWRFPPLLSARQDWERMYGKWEWRNNLTDWMAKTAKKEP